MTHYAHQPHMVRAEFFKDYGGSMKWYTTEALSMEHCWDVTTCPHAVALAWWTYDRLQVNFRIVVFDPYHRNAYPVMLDALGRDQCISDISKWDPDLLAKMRQIKIQRGLTA